MLSNDYFAWINKRVEAAYVVANVARAKGWDPEIKVDIPVAKNKAERCVNLVGSEVPEIIGCGVPERVNSLELEYGAGDFRVALSIAYELAAEKFCQFKSREKALEAGMRLGIAYVTLGTVSAPLEGFIELKLKKTIDGKDYIAIFFAGPIRASGGTSAAVSVLIADYLRFKFGYAKYDIQQVEEDRYVYETGDYNARVSRLQYVPSEEELRFLLKHVGVEITGDPTTDTDVSTGKGLDRVETDKIRGGMCLVLCEGVAQKAGKIWRKLSSWKTFGFNDWSWLSDFLVIQKRIWGEKSKTESEGVGPSYKYMSDAVAGRPIFAYPFTRGGFRLRYGRTRFTGYECLGFNPATMVICNNFLATGTQLKVERPGKGCTVTPCEVVDGPIVELLDGSVLKVNDFDEAKKISSKVKKILFLGDMLVNVGAFREHGHKLVPGAYVSERWCLELAEAVEGKPVTTRINELINNPFTVEPLLDEAIKLSEQYNIPLHPAHLFYYDVKLEELKSLSSVLAQTMPITIKPVLCRLGVPHVVNDNKIIINDLDLARLSFVLKKLTGEGGVFDLLSASAGVIIKNIAPVFIGARMGRPEKAKLRKLTGSPNCLFPCGSEGGRLRSFNSALETGFVESEFQLFYCNKCAKETVLHRCPVCDEPTVEYYSCVKCKRHVPSAEHCGTECHVFDTVKVDMRSIINSSLRHLGDQLPPLVKGVRGTSNKTHFSEPFEKGILRSKHGLCVNKDATVRIDFTELAMTHFKPQEIGASIEVLKSLGYTHDAFGAPLVTSNQVCELMPQDIIIGDSTDFHDAAMSAALIKIASFVDELLVRFYGLKPYYNIKYKKDFIGKLVICLAPHTSAGVIGRIIGYSKTRSLIAHPYMHAAVRRDCDGDEVGIMLLMDALLNFSRQYLPNRRGGKSMDAPLVLTTNVNPEEVDDEVYDFDRGWVYPLSFYRAADMFAPANKADIPVVSNFLGTEEQYHNFGFTHPVVDINNGLHATSYNLLEKMADKLKAQMLLASKTVAVDSCDIAGQIINKHFLRDIKGNLRKFTEQTFRCIGCNAKFRRVPLIGKCLKCGGKILLTVSRGTVVKYLEPSIKLADEFNVDPYLKQCLKILKNRVDGMFGWETDKQTELDSFFK
ncbi:MAG: DNA polymerase II large subunit [Candidatus Nanoarchaeia archaeon]|jgi:DNA polymerase II large subunit